MRDNFLDDVYEPYNQVYCHESGYKIFLGDVTSAVDPTIIQKQNIGIVITAAIDMDHVKFDQSIKHIKYNVFDSKTQNLSKLFTQFYDLTESQLQNRNMLVHCFAGISRSATLVISYLMKKNKWKFKEAIAYIRQSRPKVLPNLGFQRQLKDFQSKLHGFQSQYSRKYNSKTSESKKHSIKKATTLGLPEIFGLGQTIGRCKNIEPPPDISPGSQMLSRRSRLPHNKYLQRIDDIPLINTETAEPKKLPLKSFRKRSISITKRQQQQPQFQGQLYSRNGRRGQLRTVFGHKINLNQIKFATQKNIRNVGLREYNIGE